MSRIYIAYDEQEYRLNLAAKAIYDRWYSDPTLPPHWSTDWIEWPLIRFWISRSKEGKLKIDKFFKETWKLPGPIEPLAFSPGAPDGEFFLFAAGGRYYYYADRRLTVHRLEFDSMAEFMKYLTEKEAVARSRLPNVFVPQEPGTDFRWWC
ncbi:hypothetical protein C8R45DRAFT_948121 [Mycena sanguinolenta]|nr:hypothetical protein C8R45DRAFT_948121 [Mycena sanguinolenta]